jgi:hypothetical protein
MVWPPAGKGNGAEVPTCSEPPVVVSVYRPWVSGQIPGGRVDVGVGLGVGVEVGVGLSVRVGGVVGGTQSPSGPHDDPTCAAQPTGEQCSGKTVSKHDGNEPGH